MSKHTIKSYFGKTLDVTLKGDSIHLGCQRGAAEGDNGHLRIYKRADLLDALGAVSTADMAREIGEARNDAREWKARAERATEALGASQERCNEHVQEASERAEVARAKAVALAAERDHWQDRAEKAEAAIDRVTALTQCGAHSLLPETILSALADQPAFTLPTEAGAFVSARNEYGDRYEFEMWTNGADSRWMDTSGGYSPLTATELLDEFTDHRLIGADQ